jgi:hypothetical protein
MSRTTLSCSLHAKRYGTSQVGSAFSRGRCTRSLLHKPRRCYRHGLLHLFPPKPRRCRARLRCRRTCFATPSLMSPQHRRASPTAPERPQPRRSGVSNALTRSLGGDEYRRHIAFRVRHQAVRFCSLGGYHARQTPRRRRTRRQSQPRKLQCSPWARATIRLFASWLAPWRGASASRRRVATAWRSPSCCGEASTTIPRSSAHRADAREVEGPRRVTALARSSLCSTVVRYR